MYQVVEFLLLKAGWKRQSSDIYKTHKPSPIDLGTEQNRTKIIFYSNYLPE